MMRRIQLYTFLLVSIFVVSACSEAVISPTEEGHSLASSAKTTFITIDESTAGAEMPTRAALPSDGSTKATRAAVTMDEHFNLLGNDPKEFETDAYIIKEDDDMNDNANRHIAYLKIQWKQVKKVNGGFKLTTYEPKIELKWPNNNEIPIEKETDGSSKWYICGIIGGTMEPVFDAKVPLSVEFYNEDTKDQNKPLSVNGKNCRKFTIPFVAEWKKLDIKGTNKIAFSGLQFNPQGVVFHIKIKRNDKLITEPKDYNYMFASTALTRNIFYVFHDWDLDNQNSNVHILNDQKKFNKVADYWKWNYPEDQRNLGGRENYDTPDTEMAYRCKLEGDHRKGVDYDEFWVWGMPIEHGSRLFNGDGYMEHNTSITSYHGGFALGWTGPDFKKVERGEFLVANSPYGQITDEWNQPIVDWKSYNGKVIDVNLKVKRPGSKNYKWCVPLERFARSNLSRDKERQFTNNLASGTGEGAIFQRPGKSHPVNFVNVINSSLCPQGYHVPSIYEMTAAFPYFQNRLRDNWKKDKKDMTGEPLRFDEVTVPKKSPIPYYGLEYLRMFGDDYGYCQLVNFHSIYKRVKNFDGKEAIYAIRFIYNSSDDNSGAVASKIGNRYRCAYRYLISASGMNDDGRGHRLSVTARWLGNLPISIEDVATETFWENDNSMDVIRIFNVENKDKDIYQTFFTRTYKWNMGFGQDNDRYKDPYNGTFFRRAFTKNGFERTNDGAGSDRVGAIRCIANWNLDENAANAPRKQKINGHDEKYYEYVNPRRK